MTSSLKMRSFVTQIFFVLALHFHVSVHAQNETHSVEVSSTETSSSCTHNVTVSDYVCDEAQNTTEVTPPTSLRTDGDDVNVTITVVDVESTVPTEIIYLGNETETELSVNVTTVKSDISTAQQPDNTAEPVLATTEMVKEAGPVSSDICTCDLNVNIHIAFIK
jgi:hypothetical protein